MRIIPLLFVTWMGPITVGWADESLTPGGGAIPSPRAFLAATPALHPTALQAGSLRAQILPKNFTTLATELPARVDKLPVPEGGRFKTGDTLVSLDCAIQKAQLEKARAALTAAEKLASVNARLLKLNSAGELEAVTSAAEAAKARAEVSLMNATVSKCILNAPFSGRVAEQKVREHQYLQAGQPLLEILDDAHLEIEFIVPSRWLSWLAVGAPFTLHVDETGQSLPARITRIGARVDAVSQSVKVNGELTAPASGLLSGMSGRAEISPPGAP